MTKQERVEGDMTERKSQSRFILQSRPKVVAALRAVPVAMLLIGVATMAPSASATGCRSAANIAVDGGTVRNETTVRLSADGGTAVSDASGGNNNVAVGGNGGILGDGGDALAGNGGVAIASANGGMIDLDDINSGNNSGNSIAVQRASAPCSYGPGNVAVSGGTVSNETVLRLSADGGIAVADASGGNGNVAVAGLGGVIGQGGDAAAGNGLLAVASANGGAISIGDINSGDNRGNTILVQSQGGKTGGGNVRIDGGTVSNSTTIAVSADGGTAISDASGGDNNVAVGGNGGIVGSGGSAAAGNGGVAVSEANGGTVTIDDINSGGNQGNTIIVDGSQGGNVVVDGGTVTNETTIDISADGGTAVSDASGGDGNVAVGGNGGGGGDGGAAAAGNGGAAVSEANGGTVTIDDVNSGDNSGNTIVVE
jgi:hypothetical protein